MNDLKKLIGKYGKDAKLSDILKQEEEENRKFSFKEIAEALDDKVKLVKFYNDKNVLFANIEFKKESLEDVRKYINDYNKNIIFIDLQKEGK